jgi:hypothetical protein
MNSNNGIIPVCLNGKEQPELYFIKICLQPADIPANLFEKDLSFVFVEDFDGLLQVGDPFEGCFQRSDIFQNDSLFLLEFPDLFRQRPDRF